MFGIDPKGWLESASDFVEDAVDAVGSAAEAVGQAVADGAEAVGDVISDGAEAVGEAIEDGAEVAGEVLDGAVDVAEDVADYVTVRGGDVLSTAGHTLGAIVGGGLHTAGEALSDLGDAVGDFARGDFEEGFETLGKVAFDVTARAVFDTGAVALMGVVSAGQSLLGMEDPGRPLTDEEIAELREVYGDSIDYEDVRVKENVGGLLGGSGRPFTIGNTIYVPGSSMSDGTLVHEIGHVWQFQNGGTDYISDALLGRYMPGGEGYNVGLALVDGRDWEDMNPEQQSELIEQLYAEGWFAEPQPGEGEKRVLVIADENSDPDAAGGFDIVVVEAGSDEYEQAIANGYADVTDQVEDAEDAWRGGEGAA